jgi:FKBP-type peptidyl-prolyl cis-trans isomerase 2
MSKKKTGGKVWVSKNYPAHSFLYTRIEEVIEQLQEALAAQNRGEWKDLSLEIDDEYGTQSIILTGSRPENDKERQIREADEARSEEYQRKQYEALKKKFGSAEDV